MKQILSFVAVIVLAATGAMAQSGGSQATDEAAIRRLASEYESAVNSGNAQQAAAIFTPDARYTTAAGQVLKGRSQIEQELRSDFQQMPRNQMTVSTDNVRIINPQSAVATGTTSMENPPPGTTGKGHWMVLAKKDNGQWKVAEVLAAAVPAAMAEPSGQPAGTSGRASAAADSELRNLEDQWENAMKTANTGFFERLYAPNYTVVGPQGRMMTGKEDLQDIKNGAFKIESADHSEVEPRVYGDTAVVTGLSTIKGTHNGQDISGRYRWTDMFVRQNGEWKAVASQVTKVNDNNQMK